MVDRAAHDPSQPKLQTALVSKWPEGFDIESDITKQGKADTFQRTLTSALRTRGMLQPIVEAQPTLDEVLKNNPGRSVEVDINLQAHQRERLATLQAQYNSISKSAPNSPQLRHLGVEIAAIEGIIRDQQAGMTQGRKAVPEKSGGPTITAL